METTKVSYSSKCTGKTNGKYNVVLTFYANEKITKIIDPSGNETQVGGITEGTVNYQMQNKESYSFSLYFENGSVIKKVIDTDVIHSNIFKDLFAEAMENGQSLDEYGFSRSLYNCERSTYTYNDMGAGHWNGRGNYSGSFKIDYDKFKSLNAKGVYMGCYLQADGNANITGKVVAYYTDGTNTSAQTWTRADGAIGKFDYASTSITFEQDKEVDYLLFYLWGYDGSGAGSQGYVSDILLLY